MKSYILSIVVLLLFFVLNGYVSFPKIRPGKVRVNNNNIVNL